MPSAKPTVFVTGIAGNLGSRLLSNLEAFSVVGFDLRPPEGGDLARFIQLDLGEEESCRQLFFLLVGHG